MVIVMAFRRLAEIEVVGRLRDFDFIFLKPLGWIISSFRARCL